MNKNYGNLEINYIFEKIKQYCKTDTARFLYDNIVSFKKQEDVNKELDLTDEVLRLVYKYSVFPFKEDFDILQIISRLEIKSVLSVSEIFNLRLFFIMEQDIIRYFGNAKKSESKYENLDNEYMSKIMSHSKLLREIDDILDPEGQIYDNASTELKKIRKDKLLVSKEITTTLNSLLLKHSSKLSEPIITSKNGRYTLPVITSEKNKISGIVHEVSSSKQTSYIEPDEIRILSNKLESLNHLEEAEIIVIISILSNKMFDYYETIKSNYDIFIRLDYLHAKALFAKEFDCVRQKVNTNKYLKIINGRHPLIDKNKVVPISLILDNQKRTLLVTGPNTGGKTALLKLVGLFALLTMYAVPLPANEGTNINLYNEVYCDIGDNQSISESLSTFSGHLTNIIRIINGLNSNSLILLDELGGGTDPVEGQALAIAIINYIKQFKPHLIVTTHYLELKTFAYSSNDIEVASVAFDADTLQPLYYLNMGIGGASNAILIAKRLGLNSEIIKNASSNKNENASETKILLDRLNDEKVALLKEKANLDKILNDNILLKKQYEEKLLEFEFQKNKEINTLLTKKSKELDTIKQEALSILENITSGNKLPHEIAKIKNDISKLNPYSVVTNEVQDDTEIEVGDSVYIPSYNHTSKVLKIIKNKYYVEFGIMELILKKEELVKVSAQLEEPKNTLSSIRKVAYGEKTDENIVPYTLLKTNQIDLRGKRYNEVEEILDDAINKAFLSGIHTLRIVHGYGTFAIYKAVNEYIKNSSNIISSRKGGANEGLGGVTIITI